MNDCFPFFPVRLPLFLLPMITLASWVCPSGAAWAGEASRPVSVVRFATPPKIDGRLDDAAWREGAWNDDFVVADPSLKEASVQTRFKVGMDAEYFYFAAELARPRGVELVTKVADRDGPVWGDDSVELMLHPVPAMDQYLHLVINSSGTVYDALRVQGGNLADSLVNLSAQVATEVTPEAWFVEMAIPLAELGLTRDAGTVWAINVVRTSRAGDKPEVTTFAPMAGGVHKPAQFAPLHLDELNVVPFLWELSAEGDSRVVEEDGKLMLETQVLVANKTDAYLFFDLDATVRQGENELGTATFARGLDTGASRLFPLRIPVSGTGEATVDVALRNAKTRTLLSRFQFPARLDYSPLRLTLTSPSYRNTIFATQKLAEVRGAVEINLPAENLAGGSLDVRLEEADGRVLAETRLTELARSVDFTLPLPGELPVGSYRIRTVLQNPEKPLEAAVELARLGPPPEGGREVRLNENRVTLVDGEPFLPVGAMMISPSDDLETVAAQGYTTVFEYTFYWWKDDARQAWLDRLHGLGLKAVIYPYSKPEMARGAQLREPLSDEEIAGTRELILRWKDHPALLAWYLADEPELHSTLPLRLKQLDQLCRENDPYHPTIILNNTFAGIDTYGEYCDILMPNPFPGFYTGGGARRNIEYAYSLVNHAARALGGTRGVWATPQTFSWADLREERADERPPSFVDLRNMYYQSIIAGSTGFLPYSYKHGRRHPSIRLGLGYLAKELDLLKDGILAPAVRTEFTASGDGVLHTLRQAGDQHYLIVVNVSDAPREFTAVVPKTDRWHVVSENRDLAPEQGGRLRDTLPPLAARIYTTNAEIARRLDLEKAARLIDDAPVFDKPDAPLPEAERAGLPAFSSPAKPQ